MTEPITAADEARAEALSEELGEDSGEATFECDTEAEGCGRVLPYDCSGNNGGEDGEYLLCRECDPTWE